MESFADIWSLVLEEMKKNLSGTTIQLWYAELQLISLNDTSAVLLNHSDWKRDILESKHTETVKRYLEQILGYPVSVRFVSDETHTEAPPDPFKERNVPAPALSEHKPEQSEAFDLHKTEYTFDNFVVGSSNKFAHAACLAVATNPATDYNPLFIHGSSGLGKTHLLYAITNEITRRKPQTKIVYVKCEDFTNQMIEAIQRNETAQFRDKYRKVDVLLIDDVQFIAGKESTQEEFFHTFNTLYEEHKQIILTSDRPPREIKLLEDRLKTRFEWGLIADIQPPDYELRIAIMKNKAESLHIEIPNDVIVFLAENLHNNVRQLEGAVKKLGAQSFLTGVPISVDLAISCVADLMTGAEPVSVTVDRILETVSKKFGFSPDVIRGKKRTKEISQARHITIYLIRQLTDMSYPAIGKFFERDHTTIMSSCDVIENEIRSKPLLELEINELIKAIKNIKK